MSTRTPLLEATTAQRRRALLFSLLKAAVTFVVIVAIYYVEPFGGKTLGTDTLVRVAVAGIAFVAVLGWQMREILRAQMPGLRALQAVVIAVALFITGFAALYLTLSNDSGGFSEHLNSTGALYFSITLFSSVGFGDITPTSDLTRLIVCTQMLGDLVFLATVARLFFGASKMSLSMRERPDEARVPVAPGSGEG